MDVLIVDDDVVDREVIRRALRSAATAGRIVEAVSVEDGLEQQAANPFDVILLDCQMPGRSGLEMLQDIRRPTYSSATAIVMVSNAEDEDVITACIRAGAQDFLLKSEINGQRLKRAMINAQTRYELESQLRVTFERTRLLAETDQLTGLANRYVFDQSLRHSLKSAERDGALVQLLLIDLDNFKLTNDTYGHSAGDVVLQRVAEVLAASIREDELIARLGGDEFAILLHSPKSLDGGECVSKRILKALGTAHDVRFDAEVHIGASIGIASSPGGSVPAEDLMRHADIAMYRAKKSGRNQACFYDARMQQYVVERTQMEAGLRQALNASEFELYYQPVFREPDGSLWGFEALLRWNKGGRVLLPESFLGVAEETRLIQPIGNWTIRQALEDLAGWNIGLEQPLHLAINLSAAQIESSDLFDTITAALKTSNIAAECLEFEITETMLLDHTEQNIGLVTALSSHGCSIALDDFGTGFSSISHLLRFPINVVKLDRTMMPLDPDSSDLGVRLTTGLAGMLNAIGMESVAEGVETEVQSAFCHELHFSRLQGFHLGRPQPAADISAVYVEKQARLH